MCFAFFHTETLIQRQRERQRHRETERQRERDGKSYREGSEKFRERNIIICNLLHRGRAYCYYLGHKRPMTFLL